MMRAPTNHPLHPNQAERQEKAFIALQLLEEKVSLNQDRLAAKGAHRQSFLTHQVNRYHQAMGRPTAEQPLSAAPTHQDILHRIQKDLGILYIDARSLSSIIEQAPLALACKVLNQHLTAVKKLVQAFARIRPYLLPEVLAQINQEIHRIQWLLQASSPPQQEALSTTTPNQSTRTLNLAEPRQGFHPSPIAHRPRFSSHASPTVAVKTVVYQLCEETGQYRLQETPPQPSPVPYTPHLSPLYALEQSSSAPQSSAGMPSSNCSFVIIQSTPSPFQRT